MTEFPNTQTPHLGISALDSVPYGLHTCHFFSSRDELLAALVPYFMAGLRSNERCLWITAPPLPSDEAARALSTAQGGIDDAIRDGTLRILDFDQWYASSAELKGPDVVQLWLEEEEHALAGGYQGLRIAGNLSFIKREDWPQFMDYEQAVTAAFKGRRIIALCSYDLHQCDGQQTREAGLAHHCVLAGTNLTWHVV